jgi:hypothetical protein
MRAPTARPWMNVAANESADEAQSQIPIALENR